MKASFDSILEVVGGFGVWQGTIVAATFVSGMLLLFHSICSVFDSAAPREYWCKVEGLEGVNWTEEQVKAITIPRDGQGGSSQCLVYDRNYSSLVGMTYEEAGLVVASSGDQQSTTPCHDWMYDPSPFLSTTVTEWGLVCERAALRPTIQTVAVFGVMCSTFISGLLADKFGRKRSIVGWSLVQTCVMFGTAFSPNYYLYLFLRFVTGMACYGLYAICFVLVSEVVDTRRRSTACLLFDIGASLGFIFTSGISYWLREWRHLHFAAAGVSFTFLIFSRLIPESPRWLILKGRMSEAEGLLLRAARMNGRGQMTNSDDLRTLMEDFRQSEVEPVKGTSRGNCCDWLKHVVVFWRTPAMRAISLIIFWDWFAIGLVVNSLFFMGALFPAGPHLVFVIFGCQKLLVRFLLIWLITRIGRRFLFASSFFIMSVFLCIFTVVKAVSSPDLYYISVALIVLARVGSDINFTSIYIYTGELYPTEVRGHGVTTGAMHSRIGGMIAPYLVDYTASGYGYVAGVVLTLCSFLAGLVTFRLPETRGRKLQETVQELEQQSRGDNSSCTFSLMSTICWRRPNDSQRSKSADADTVAGGKKS